MDLDCIGVISVVNKKELQVRRPTWDMFTVSWAFLLDRYDKYLKKNSITNGEITIDKSSNKTQQNTINIINQTRRCGTKT